MDEAEVAEAYRERILREMAAMQPLAEGEAAERDRFPPQVESRIHRGLNPRELALWREDTGEERPPGWMSVVVVPQPLRPNLLDPIRDASKFRTAVQIPDRWETDLWPIEFFQLRASPDGLFAQLPDRDDLPPAYVLAMHRDGLMEFGTTLAPGLRQEDPDENRVVFSFTQPAQAHDYLQALGVALGELGHQGTVAAQVSFEHTRDARLWVSAGLGVMKHRITRSHVRGDIWRLETTELISQAGLIVKQVTDWLWLAAGIPTGNSAITDDGELVRRNH